MCNQCRENQRFRHFVPYSQQFLLKRNKTYFFSILGLTSTEYEKEVVKVYDMNDYTLFHLSTEKVKTNYWEIWNVPTHATFAYWRFFVRFNILPHSFLRTNMTTRNKGVTGCGFSFIESWFSSQAQWNVTADLLTLKMEIERLTNYCSLKKRCITTISYQWVLPCASFNCKVKLECCSNY